MDERPEKGRKAPGRTRNALALDKIAFVLAVAAVVFVGGMAAAHYDTLPYRMLNDAKGWLNARLKMENDDLPSHIDEFFSEPKGPVAAALAPGAGAEPLIVSGGPLFAHMDACPKFGCLAWVINRRGEILHAWPSPDPETFFADMKGFVGRTKRFNYYIIGMAPDRDGSIVVNFHARNVFPYQVGMAKFDIDGNLLWKRFDHSHHWPSIGPDGTIYTPHMRLGPPGPLPGKGVHIKCGPAKVYWEGVKVLSSAGEELHNFSLAEVFSKGGFPGLAYSVPDSCDPFHVNGVGLVNAAGAEKLNAATRGQLPMAREGDLLVSIRESSTLAVLDKDTGQLKRTFTGRSAAQHSPHFLPDGDIVVFDNLGGDTALGGSRVMRLNPATRQASTIFPTEASKGHAPFYSETAGAIGPSADGKRILVTDNEHGALLEIETETGRVLWRYENIFDYKPFFDRFGIKAGEDTYVRPRQNGGFYVTPEDFTPEAYARLTGPAASGSGPRPPGNGPSRALDRGVR